MTWVSRASFLRCTAWKSRPFTVRDTGPIDVDRLERGSDAGGKAFGLQEPAGTVRYVKGRAGAETGLRIRDADRGPLPP